MRLLYDISVEDDAQEGRLRVSGACRATGGEGPVLAADERFVFTEGRDRCAFQGMVPYEKLAFMPEGLFVVRDFYPAPARQDLPCDVQVRLSSPRATALATGRLREGVFREDTVDSFALVLSDAFPYLTDRFEEIDLFCLHYPQNPALARTVLGHAKDDLAACVRLLGFFPYQSLTFVPGSDVWHGGAPLASGVLALHQRPDDAVLMGNNWIIAHEICHEYWGEYVRDREMTGWLSIGLGLATDAELTPDPALHQEDLRMYLEACEKGQRTAIDVPEAEFSRLMEYPDGYDYNSAVIHGKSGLIMDKIKQDIGKDAFFAALKALLGQFAGRSIDRTDFLAAIQRASGRDYTSQLNHWLATDRCIL